jgi:hypothetical protein
VPVWTVDDLRVRGFAADGTRIKRIQSVDLLFPELPPVKERGYAPHEQRLQRAIVLVCRPLLIPGARLLGTNGEIPGGNEVRWRAGIRKGMGYMRGMPDLLARSHGVLLWLEIKVPPNKPTDEQLEFGRWAHSIGDHWEVVTSVAEAGKALQQLGLIR